MIGSELPIKRLPLSDLNPAAYNPRTRLEKGSAEYERLKKSIIEFGNVQPVVFNKRSGNIVGGHQRYWILKDMGIQETEVAIVDLDDDHEKALNLALNKPAGSWDLVQLNDILNNLDSNLRELTQFADGEAAEMMVQFDASFATDFLNLGEGLEGKASVGDPESKEDHPHRTGEQFFTMQLVLSEDQRDTVMQAIMGAKQALSLDSSMEAITAVCEYYMREE